jgi:class 3 adenylate cyclase/tetratricopeptide (TPR) repeat protein
MTCASCGGENQPGKRFCGDCGEPLAAGCPGCGGANEPGKSFCGDCGAPLATAVPVASTTSSTLQVRELPSAERRLVSVLFADLVGFTTLSEARDSEDVREILSSYFETCRTLINRYGGTVEKFIGDAVMAVWGTPVATEDDAERAVRAALELAKAVAALGEEAGAPELRARVGVLTGEAAVTLGAEGQGMVAGDIVNTASRIQSAARPGEVYVGESTARAAEASIVFEDAGIHELKGKAEPVRLLRAVRVVAGSLGAQRSSGLEAPCVGRDRELRLIKELFHASAEEGKAALVSVTGIAGIGKSRLSWEFEKYVDGLADDSLWHRGRCLSYGEGVAYWALVDMVKMRCRIAEDEDTASALAKLRSTIEEFIPDAEERRWVEPRLAHLLAIDGGAMGDQENVFSAWRTFFERLAARYPVVMVFEDMQWADAGMLDFVEYLLEWSRGHRIFILALARPEIHDRRPSWGAGKRSFSSIYLEPLSAASMEDLLSGLVPGLPGDVRAQILERAQGVPLYAVETVRMLLDRGLLVREGAVYSPTGPIDSLEVPETLHALIAARLDGLSPDERRVVQDGAVLGKTFFKQGLARVSGMTEEEVEPLLAALLRKEVLSLQADPRSPERGQYGFLQDLMRKVAYDTLSKKDRKTKHLAAAAFIEDSWTGEEDEIVEVVAAHYLSAYEAAPDADDAEPIRTTARDRFAAAGDRAASLAAPAEAQRYLELALTLTDDPSARAMFLERAGALAWQARRGAEAEAHFLGAISMFESIGLTHAAARVSAALGEVEWSYSGLVDEAVARMEEAYEVLRTEEPDADLATLAAELGRFHYFRGEIDLALERVDAALEIAEGLGLPEVISQALNTKGIVATARARPEEGIALLRHALTVALDNDRSTAALRAFYNLAELTYGRDRYAEAIELHGRALELATRAGNLLWEQLIREAMPYPLFMSGRWDDALERAGDVSSWDVSGEMSAVMAVLPTICVNRGLDEGLAKLSELAAGSEGSSDVQRAGSYAIVMAVVRAAEGSYGEALEFSKAAAASGLTTGADSPLLRIGFAQAVDAAFALGDLAQVEAVLDLIGGLRRGEVWPSLVALGERTNARLAVARGEADAAEKGFAAASATFRQIGVPYWLAATLTEHAELLVAAGRAVEADEMISEARDVFEQLEARPWLDRLDRIPTGTTALLATH